MNYCAVLGGPLYASAIPYILAMCASVPCIISTWETESEEAIRVLRGHAVDIVLNTPPEFAGVQHVNYANKSIFSGIQRAIELGYTHALRFRTDLFSPQFKPLCDIFAGAAGNALVAICWYNHIVPPHAPHGYIMDHVMFGPCDELIKYRSSYQLPGDERYTEHFLQDCYFQRRQVSYNDVKDSFAFAFVLPELISHNIELHFTHHHADSGDLIRRYKSDVRAYPY